MKEVLGIVGTIIVAAIAGTSFQTVVNNLSMSSARSAENKVEERFRLATEEIRPTLPKKVDDITTWMGVSYSGTSLTYEFRLDMKAAELPQNALTLVRQNTVKQLCKTSSVVNNMKEGGVYIYRYQTADAKSLGTFEVRSKDCGE